MTSGGSIHALANDFATCTLIQLDDKTTRGLANASSVAKPNTKDSANLSQLPNELLHQILRYLTPSEDLEQLRDCGISTEVNVDNGTTHPGKLGSRAGHFRPLLDLALTCKSLVPVAQEALFASVSITGYPETLPEHAKNRSTHASFLSAVLGRSDLATRVKRLAVDVSYVRAARGQYWEGLDLQIDAFTTLVKKMRLTPEEERKWETHLLCPTEATICGLIFAALPNLQSVAIDAHPYKETEEDNTAPIIRRAGYPYSEREEITCLSQGLAVTSITDLSLSANLNGLYHARLPSLTTLTLDYSSPNPFAFIGKGSFLNVNFLRIKASDYDCPEYWDSFSRTTSMLFKGLPRINTLELQSANALQKCWLPSSVETIIMRPADQEIVDYLNLQAEKGNDTSLKLFELHWPDEETPCPKERQTKISEMVRQQTGAELVMTWRERPL